MQHTPSGTIHGLRTKVAAGLPIVGVSTGIEATCEEVGELDFIAVHSSDRYRTAGSDSLGGFLAYGNANQIVREMIPPLVQVFQRVPVLAGVCGVDPFLLRSHLLHELLDLGIAGIQNHPTVGLIDGNFRKNLEDTGMSFSLEVELLAEAHALGLLTAPFVFEPEQARWMADAGADLLIAHPGLPLERSTTARPTRLIRDYLEKIRQISDVAKTVRSDILVLCYSAPFRSFNDLRSFLEQCPAVAGYFETVSIARIASHSPRTARANSNATIEAESIAERRSDGAPWNQKISSPKISVRSLLGYA